jgi:starch phosphorylase
LNGALTIGTDDGANVEIREAVGDDNIFIFGMSTAEVADARERGYQPRDHYTADPELRQVIDQIGSGHFSSEEPTRYHPIVQTLLDHGDHYMLLADHASYMAAQDHVDALYADRQAWNAMAIRNVAAMGPFSSDRTIREYAEGIWRVQPLAR